MLSEIENALSDARDTLVSNVRCPS